MNIQSSILEFITAPLIDTAEKIAKKPFEIASDLSSKAIHSIAEGIRKLISLI